MKKAVILVLAFVLLSATAFADFSWGMWGRTELALLRGDNADDSDIISLWGPDWWTNGYQYGGPYMGFNLSWSNDTFGYNWSFQFDNEDIFGENMGDQDNFRGADVTQLNGTSKVIPDLLTLKIGLISEGGYNYNPPTAGDWGGKKHGDIWEVWSMMLTLAPADMGLKVMLNYRVPMGPDLSNGWQNLGNGAPVADCLKTVDVCAQYTIPGTASITGGTLGSNNMVGMVQNEIGRPIFLTVKLFMIPNLNLDLSGQYNLANSYDLDDLGEHIDDNNTDGVDDTASLSGILGVTYTLDALIIKGTFWLYDYMNEDQTMISYRTGLALEYSAGDFWIAMFNAYTFEYSADADDVDGDLDFLESTRTKGILEINPVVKHNPSGIQLGFYMNYDLDSEYMFWSIPIQIDFSF